MENVILLTNKNCFKRKQFILRSYLKHNDTDHVNIDNNLQNLNLSKNFLYLTDAADETHPL